MNEHRLYRRKQGFIELKINKKDPISTDVRKKLNKIFSKKKKGSGLKILPK